MGAWGTGILEDDLAAGVYGDYMEMYDEGQHTGNIRAELLDSAGDYVLSKPVFWLALAQAQWECGCLDREVLTRVEHLIATGADPTPSIGCMKKTERNGAAF